MSATSEPAAKRGKTAQNQNQNHKNQDEPQVDFKLTFPQPQTLRSLVEIVKDILPDLSVEVQKLPTFEGINVENIDDKKSCVVQARLHCEVTMNAETSQFTVAVDTLAICLRTVASHYVLDFIKYTDSDDVELVSRDAISNNIVNVCRMNTLAKMFTKTTMSTQEYDYTLQLDLSEFRSIVKVSKDLSATTLKFSIFSDTDASRNVKSITFKLKSKGKAEHQHFFRASVTDDGVYTNDESITDASRSPGDLVYEEDFSVTYLNTFLKAMERQVVTLRMSQEKPLVVLYPLGAESSYICFVLASKMDDE